MYACQIYQAAAKDLPTLDEDIAAGKFAPLRTWLKEKVHKARAHSCRPAVRKLRCVVMKKCRIHDRLDVDACMRGSSCLLKLRLSKPHAGGLGRRGCSCQCSTTLHVDEALSVMPQKGGCACLSKSSRTIDAAPSASVSDKATRSQAACSCAQAGAWQPALCPGPDYHRRICESDLGMHGKASVHADAAYRAVLQQPHDCGGNRRRAPY